MIIQRILFPPGLNRLPKLSQPGQFKFTAVGEKTLFIWNRRLMINRIAVLYPWYFCLCTLDVCTETKSCLSLLEACLSSLSPEQCLHLARFCRQVLLWRFVAPFSDIICSEIKSHNWDYYMTLLISKHTHSSTKDKCMEVCVCQRPALEQARMPHCLQHNCKHTIASSRWLALYLFFIFFGQVSPGPSQLAVMLKGATLQGKSKNINRWVLLLL